MKQSRLMSFLESTISTLAGFGISLAAQWFFLPLLGVAITFTQNVVFALIMTAVSIGRGFVLRRLFEALHIRRPLSPFMQAVIAERYRQVEVEGWDAEHDDAHARGELAQAGAAYLIGDRTIYQEDCESTDDRTVAVSGRLLWPWEVDWWKPQGFRRDLARGCALGIAEGEKCDRNRKPVRRTAPRGEACGAPARGGDVWGQI